MHAGVCDEQGRHPGAPVHHPPQGPGPGRVQPRPPVRLRRCACRRWPKLQQAHFPTAGLKGPTAASQVELLMRRVCRLQHQPGARVLGAAPVLCPCLRRGGSSGQPQVAPAAAWHAAQGGSKLQPRPLTALRTAGAAESTASTGAMPALCTTSRMCLTTLRPARSTSSTASTPALASSPSRAGRMEVRWLALRARPLARRPQRSGVHRACRAPGGCVHQPGK